ncbi:hypothetical protein D1F64_04655 [Breoghania sp. L-A4]|nr:hypothetical protein D1F64_04655 [Breoghania sp. L-A4]
MDAADVYLDRKTAIIARRTDAPGASVTQSVSVPFSSFRGVAARVEPAAVPGEIRVTLELLHSDPRLSLALMQADCMDDVVADWQAWSRQFGVPLLLIEQDGRIREIAGAANRAQIGRPGPRRRSSVLRERRPRFLIRRRTGHTNPMPLHAGEREIIART